MKTSARPLALPYESREPMEMIRRIKTAMERRGDRLVVLFAYTVLREHLVECEASRVDFSVKRVEARDVLSGLKHEVPSLEIILDDCVIRARWVGSRLRIEPRDVLNCRKCRKIG